jgi:Fic family protein
MNAGTYQEHGVYKTFQPRLLADHLELSDKEIAIFYGDAMRYLGELNAYSQLVPNIDYFIRMYIAKEATTSSKIEGTNTNLTDLLQDDEDSRAELNTEQRDDLEEVQNYIKAINQAIASLQTLPLANRLVCETHRTLLSGVRGFTRAPGEIRRVQNWIGGGNDIKSAVFIPPSPESLPELLTDLENYWHNNTAVPALIKTALTHYQFETIHPFLDGNGRVGRLMIGLQLIDAKILTKPALYISDYFERYRSDYYDALERVRHTGDYNHWVRFFLGAVVDTAKDAKNTLQSIVNLDREYIERIQKSPLSRTRQNNARELLTMLYGQPIVSIRQVEAMTGYSFQTSSDLVKKLEEMSILREITNTGKNRRYVLTEYFDLFNKPRGNHE